MPRQGPSRLARIALIALLVAIAAWLVLAPTALAGVITPEDRGGSRNADDIHLLYTIALAIGALIFLLVEGLLIYSIVKFRRRRGGPEPAQVRGNTPLEVSWTIGAGSILVVLAVLTFIFLGPIKNPQASGSGGYAAAGEKLAAVNQPPPPGPPSKHLEIHVNGQQFLWRYDYTTPNASGQGQVFSYYRMVVPINTTVVLNLTSSDVVHSWWIPALGGKAQTVPGHVNHTWFRVTSPGRFTGNCAQLCGKGHADMRAEVDAVTPAQFRSWLTAQAAAIRQSQALLSLSRRIRGNGS